MCWIAETILGKHAKTKIIETQSHKDLLQVPSFEAFGVQGGTFTVNLPEFCDLECDFPYGEISIDDSNSGSAKSDGLNTHQEKVRVLSSRYSNCIPTWLFQHPLIRGMRKVGHFYLLIDQLQLEKVYLSVHTKLWHHSWDWVLKHVSDLCCFEWTDKRVLHHLVFQFSLLLLIKG